jgi:opacity protein-like surface antigen
MIHRTLISAVLVLMVANSAEAQRTSRYYPSRDHNWEFSVQTRYTVAQTFSGEGGSLVELKDDLGWGFGFAYNMSQHWSLGFGFTWRSIPYTAVIVDQDDPQNQRAYSGDLSISTIALSGMWNVLRGRITPYASGVTGMTLIDTNIYAGSISGCWWDPWWGPICGTYPTTYGKTAWSFALGAGLRAELSESFYLMGGYEYAQAEAASIEGTSLLRVDIGWLFQ